MKEEVKETLTEEYEKIAKEVEGKSEEELREMEIAAQNEIYQKQISEASEYVYHVMNLGTQYNEEEFIKVLDDIDKQNSTEEGNKAYGEEHYTSFTKEEAQLGMIILNLGYGTFGKQFIDNMVKDDPESAKRVLEIVTQQHTELNDTIEFIKANAETMLNEKKKEEVK